MTGIEAPLVIAGTGGSGTRMFMRIARHTGRFMGDDASLNLEGDAKELMPFANRWIRPYWRARLRGELPADWLDLRDDLERRLARHRASLLDAGVPWGWKQPRSIYFVPIYDELFPHMRFVHVVRDGRDFAKVWKKDMVRVEDLFLDTELLVLPRSLRVVALWARINELAADYGERELGDRYLRVTLEELLAQPEAVLSRVLPFMGWNREPTDAMRAEIGPTRSIGRWRSLDPKLQEQVTAVGEPALRRFGYLVNGDVALPKREPTAARPMGCSDRLAELERRLEESDRKLEVMTHARARTEEAQGAQLDELAGGLEQVRSELERTQASRAWSWGHRLARLARMLTLRRPGSTSALEQAAVALERTSHALEHRDR